MNLFFHLRIFICIFLWALPFISHARVYFIHIPKTAGTTMRSILEQQLEEAVIYPRRNHFQPSVPVRQELVSGHFPYWFCKRLDPEFENAFKITILRDPVERYLSFLRAKKRSHPQFQTLESVFQERLKPKGKFHRNLVDNLQCRFLAEDPFLEGEALVESAKKGLEIFDCVLFFDHFAQDVVDMLQRLGIDPMTREIPHLNATVKEPVSDLLLAELRQCNHLDIALYEYAKSHLEKKNTQYHLQ